MAIKDAEDPDVRIEIEAVYTDSAGIEARLAALQSRIGTTNREVNELERRFRGLNDSLRLVKAATGGTTDGLKKAGDAAKSSAEEARQGSQEWQKLEDAISQARGEYKAFRREQITGADEGPTLNPATLSIGKIRDDIAVLDAQRASYETAIRNIGGGIDRNETAIRGMEGQGDLEKEIAQYGRLTVARRQAREATQELADAQQQLGRSYGSDNGQQRLDATERYRAALEKSRTATRELASAEAERERIVAEQDRVYNDYLDTQRRAAEQARANTSASQASIDAEDERRIIDQLTRSHGALHVARLLAESSARELADAERQLAAAQAAGNPFAEAAATKQVADAKRNATDATIALARAQEQQNRVEAAARKQIGAAQDAISANVERIAVERLTRAYGQLQMAEREAGAAGEAVVRARVTMAQSRAAGDIRAQAQAWDEVAAAERRAADATIQLERLQRQAQDRITGAQKSIDASKEAADLDKLTHEYGTLYVAQRQAKDAARDLAAAQQELGRARATGGLEEQAKAWERVADAQRRATDATVAANREFARQNATMNDMQDVFPRVRYALYDVATTTGILATSILAAEAAAATLSGSYESSFTGVERTSRVAGDGAEYLRSQLEGLTREIPETFASTSQIATLGAQLDIQASNLAGFTETVAQFTATAGTDIETTAQGFGRIGQLLDVSADKYGNLGSAILYAGNTSVATEADVLAYSQRLAIAGNEAGFTADQTIALASTLASLGVGLEASQGATQRIFQDINRAVEGNTEKLGVLAAISGMTAEQYAAAWKGDPQAAFSSLLTGISEVENRTQALDALGFVDTREVRTLTALTDNLAFYNEQLVSTGQAYADGTYLAQSYGMVVDDLASRWQIFLNALSGFGAAAGDAVAPTLKVLLDSLSSFLNVLTDVLQTPAGQWFAGGVLAAMALVGALAAVATGSALSIAALYALRTAVVGLGWNTATSGAGAFIASLLGVNTASATATVGVNVFKVALASTGIGLAVVLLGTLATAFMQSGESAQNAFSTYVTSTAGLAEALASDQQAYLDAAASGNFALAESYRVTGQAASENTGALSDNARAIENTATVLGITPMAYGSANSAIATNTAYLGENTIAWLKNQLMQSEAFQNLAGNADFTKYWTAVGADMNEVIKASASGGQQAVLDYFAGLEAAAIAGGTKFQSAFSSFTQTQYGIQTFNTSGLFGLGGSAAGNGLDKLSSTLDGFNGQMLLAGKTGTSAGQAIAAGADEGTSAYQGLSDAIGGSGGVVEQLRTVEDYANDLQGVFDRAFDLRFGNQQALDTIASSWIKLKEEAEKAAQSVKDYRAELDQLTADKSLQEYWLKNAEGYGDTMRSEQIRADLAETNNKIAKTTESLADAQGKLDKSTDGNSKSAIENRSALYDLASQYDALLVQYASSGMSQADLAVKAAELKAEFMAQAAQLGYTGEAVVEVGQHFDGLITIIEQVPRNVDIEVDANTDPAAQALKEFIAKARQQAANAGVNIPITSSYDGSGPAKAARAAFLSAQLASWQATYDRAIKSGADNQAVRAMAEIQRIASILSSGNYYTGGYTGSGGKYEAAGVVHRDEYVFDQDPTNRWGVGTLDRLRSADGSTIAAVKALLGVGGMAFQQSAPQVTRIVAPGVAGRTGPSYVELSPVERLLLAQIRDAVAAGINLDGNALQRFAGAGNVNSDRRGKM